MSLIKDLKEVAISDGAENRAKWGCGAVIMWNSRAEQWR